MFEEDAYEEISAFYRALDNASAVTLLTHLNPDADTIGTALGIYHLVKRHLRVPVEVVNLSDDLPVYLDFLPGFERIKRKRDFDGLVIACDGADISRFGLDAKELEGATVVNIDHHAGNTRFGHINIVSSYASTGETAFEIFKPHFVVTKEAAQCFYTALVSDTRHFTVSAVDEATFRRASELIALGANPARTAYNLTQRKSLASLRLLQRALASLRLYDDATVAVMMLYPEDFEATGARMSDLDGIVEYGRMLATVDVALLISAFDDGKVRVSMRSKRSDVAAVLASLGGGGHPHAAGVMLSGVDPQQIRDTILRNISEIQSENDETKKE